jgi:hypothetical protein
MQVPMLDMPPGMPAGSLAVAMDGQELSADGTKVRFIWRLDNFSAFKTILETRKVFSR